MASGILPESCLALGTRLLPFIMLLLIPAILTAIGGHMLNWERIFLMIPDALLGWSLIALLNLAIVFSCLVWL
ncbi:hypothetical protein GCM10028817_36380 [Spirosoma pomorum]